MLYYQRKGYGMFVNVSKNKNCAQVIQYLKQYTSEEFQKDPKVLGLIFESHFLDVSNEVLESLKHLNWENKNYSFALCVSKGIQGNSLYHIQKEVENLEQKLNYMEHVILGEDLSGEASFQGEKKSSELKEKIRKISSELSGRERKELNVGYSKLSSFFAGFLRIPFLYTFLNNSLDGNRCRKCGHCRGVCPTHKKIQKSS